MQRDLPLNLNDGLPSAYLGRTVEPIVTLLDAPQRSHSGSVPLCPVSDLPAVDHVATPVAPRLFTCPRRRQDSWMTGWPLSFPASYRWPPDAHMTSLPLTNAELSTGNNSQGARDWALSLQQPKLAAQAPLPRQLACAKTPKSTTVRRSHQSLTSTHGGKGASIRVSLHNCAVSSSATVHGSTAWIIRTRFTRLSRPASEISMCEPPIPTILTGLDGSPLHNYSKGDEKLEESINGSLLF